MLLIVFVVAAGALALATLVPGVAWLAVQAWRRRVRARAWRRLLVSHVVLFGVHLVVSVPLALAFLGPWWVHTRGDERAYAGPRIDEDGKWRVQEPKSLGREPEAGGEPARATAAARSRYEVAVAARDGARLRGFLVPPVGGEPAFSAVLVHGLFRGALELEPVGSMLRDLGGEVLLLELRRHGGSERRRFTYGRDEADDVLGGVDFLRARPGAGERPLVLFAVSIGTAAAAIAAPRIERLDALILDAPIDDLRATAERLLATGDGRGGSLPQPLRGVLLGGAQLFGTIPFDDVVPRHAIAALSPTVPILMIGAGQDARVPPDAVRAYFDSLPTEPAKKQLWIVDEAKHGHVWLVDPEGYRRQLRDFLAPLARTPSD